MKLSKYLGLKGVHEAENPLALKWGAYFNILMMGAVVWLLFQWHYEFTNQLSFDEAWQGNFIIWLFFVSETACLTCLVKNRRRYLKGNWLNLVIIFMGIPLLFIDYGPVVTILRALRIFFIIGLLIPWVSLSIKFLTDNRLDTTIFAGVVILLLAAVLIVEIDPNINSIKEGIWWAWVTISTVGYGDVVPTSSLGRLFASVLIFIGLGLFSIITANFAALFIQQDAKAKNKINQDHWAQSVLKFEEISTRQKELMAQVERLNEKVDAIEGESKLISLIYERTPNRDNNCQ